MRFEHRVEYAAPPSQVYEMLTDPAFREKVCRFVKAPEHHVAVSAHGDQVSVRVDQTQRVRKVPGFAAKIVGETVKILQVERWTSPTAADLELTIPGKPGYLHGLVALDPVGESTVELVTGELKVSVPLVGGKLESLVEGLFHRFLDAQHAVGQAWLAGDR